MRAHPHGGLLVGEQITEQPPALQRLAVDGVQRLRIWIALVGVLYLAVPVDSFAVAPQRVLLR